MASPRWFSWGSLLLVVLGGAAGVALRALILLPLGAGAHPLVVPGVTLAINLAGSLVLGVIVGWAGERKPRFRSFFGTGMMGGFTTYSAFAVQTVTTGTASPVMGSLLILLSLFAGVFAGALGLVLGRRAAGLPTEVEAPEDAE